MLCICVTLFLVSIVCVIYGHYEVVGIDDGWSVKSYH